MSKYIGILSFCLVLAIEANADISIIVNPKNQSVWKDENVQHYIKDIFMNKKEKFPNGISSKPIDQKEGRTIRNNFYMKIAGKDEAGMNVYWSNLIFTGNGRPPQVVEDDAGVRHFVSGNIGGIGYIDSEMVDKTVKVIYTLK